MSTKKIRKDLSAEERLGQLICSSSRVEDETLEMAKRGVLGAIWGLPQMLPVREAMDWIAQLQEEAKYPLLICGDFETGTARRFKGGTELPTGMAIGATNDEANAYLVGELLAKELNALGFNLVGSPVVDVNVNPHNPIINVRAYGDRVDLVTRMGVAFVKGVQNQGIYACCKHFPGHGDTDLDSHRALPIVRHDMGRLEKVEFAPYRATIQAGVKAIMTSHIVFSSLDDEHPATLSKKVLTGLLRNQLGFRDLIFTDAMAMHAIAHNYNYPEAVRLAVNAGADFLIVNEPQKSLDILKEEMKAGRIDKKRVMESNARILAAKEELGLFKRPLPRLRAEGLVGCREHREAALNVERKAVVVKDPDKILPVQRAESISLVTVANYRKPVEGEPIPLTDGGSALAKELRDLPIKHVFHLGYSDMKLAESLLESEAILVGLFVTVMAYRPEGGIITPQQREFIEGLLRSGRRVFVLSFGNPYPLSTLSGLQSYLCAFGVSGVCLKAATEVLTGKYPAQGVLPINL